MAKKKNDDYLSSIQQVHESRKAPPQTPSSNALQTGTQSVKEQRRQVIGTMAQPASTPKMSAGATPYQIQPFGSLPTGGAVQDTVGKGGDFAAKLKTGVQSLGLDTLPEAPRSLPRPAGVKAFQNFNMSVNENAPQPVKEQAARALKSYIDDHPIDWKDPKNNAQSAFGDDELGDKMRAELKARQEARKVTIGDFFADPLYAISTKLAPVEYDVESAARALFAPSKNEEYQKRRKAYNDALKAPEKTDTALALQGVLEQGANEFNSGLASTADMYLGAPLRALGWEDNPLHRLNESMKASADADEAFYAKNMENASQAAKTMERLGSQAVAAVPDLVLAYFTAGSSLEAQGAGALAKGGTRLAGKEAAVAAARETSRRAAASEMARQVSQTSLKNPMFWTSFARTAGPSYEYAKENGATDFQAALYGTANAVMNAQVEIGGGVQNLPKEMKKGGSALLAWIKSNFEEGREEVVQGWIERALQNLAYGADNPIASVDDEKAVFNLVGGLKEFGSGAAVAGILGGPSSLVQGARNLQTGRQAAQSETAAPDVPQNQNAEIAKPKTMEMTPEAPESALPSVQAEPRALPAEDPADAAARAAAQPDPETRLMTDQQKAEYARKLMEEGVDEQEVFRRTYGSNTFTERQSTSAEMPAQDSSPALDKLGVKISSPITVNYNRSSLVQQSRAAKATDRKVKAQIKALEPTRAEMEFARGLADGTYQENEIPMSMDSRRVKQLSDLLKTQEDNSAGYIAQIRRDIKRNFREKLEGLFKTADLRNVPGMFSLNMNTMQRNIRRIFKGAEGDAINEMLFDPVLENSAEKIRFENRMFDRVRGFNLSKVESVLVARVLEGRAVQREYAMLDPETKEYVDDVSSAENPEVVRRDFGNVNTAENYEFAMRYKAWLATQARLAGQDVEKINKAADAYTAAYNDFYDAINDFLVNHGYEPIGFVKGYTPHLQPDQAKTGLAGVLHRLGLDTEVTVLPTEIAGRTDTFKPGKQWNPYFLHRLSNGPDTDYNAVEGYESYVNYMGNVLYHTDDIMKLRETSNYFRARYAQDEVRDLIEQAQDIANKDTEEKVRFLIRNNKAAPGTVLTDEQADAQLEEYIQSLYADSKNMTKYGGFVTWLDDYTNRLAGKQTAFDRAFESVLGRRFLNIGNRLTKIFGEATIVGNISSALNQTEQIPQLIRAVGNVNVLHAMNDIITGETRRGDWDKQSDFLTGKRGIDYLSPKSGYQKVMDFAAIPFEAVDDVTSQLYVRAKYVQCIKQGMDHQAAMKAADKFATEMVGSRIQGAKPMVFEIKMLKPFTTFQLEIANNWAYISQDLPEEYRQYAKENGTAKAAAKVTGDILKYMISAWLMNWLGDELYGGSPAPLDLIGYTFDALGAEKGITGNEYMLRAMDNLAENLTGERKLGTDEIPEGIDTGAAATSLLKNAARDLPYVSNVGSALGVVDSRMPLPSFPSETIGDMWNVAAGGFDLLRGGDGEKAKKAVQNLPEDAAKELKTWLPMGNQIYKTYTGAKALARGGSFSGTGEDEKMQYQMPRNLLTGAQAVLFGKNATKPAQDWFASNYDSLSKAETQAFKAMVKDGTDEKTAYQVARQIHNVTGETDAEKDEKKRAIIRNADLSDASKRTLFSKTVSDSQDDDFKAMQKAGISFNQSLDLYEKYLSLYHDDEMKAGEKATEFAQYVDGTRLSSKQADLAKETFRFWMNMPANADKYEGMRDAGLSVSQAEAVTDALDNIEIDPWKDEASPIQKYTAIVELDIPESAQSAAIKSIMTDSIKLKYEQTERYNVTPAQYVAAYQAILDTRDKYGKTSTTAKIATEAISSIPGLTKEQRAALWQIQNKSWKPSSNPYSQKVGAIVRTALYDEPDNRGELFASLDELVGN